MGVVKIIPYVNRLAKVVAMPGGKRLADAVADADANLMSIKGSCLEALDVHLARIRELAGASAPSDAALDEIYSLSNEVLGIAGLFGMPDLGKAAYSLCELIDSRGGQGCSRKALDVHIDSLRLLRFGDAVPQAERENMIAGLAAVVAHAKRTRADAAGAVEAAT
jgi:hypothetical protein